MADELIYLPDGRVLRRPDDLQDDQIDQFKLDFATKFPFAMPEEETVLEEEIVETPLSTEPVIDYSTVAPIDRPPEFYDERNYWGDQIKAGGASTLQAGQTTFNRELGLKNLTSLVDEIKEAEEEYENLQSKEQKGTILDDEKERLQKLHVKLYGTGESLDITEGFPGQPMSSTMISMEEKSKKGLKRYLEDLHKDYMRIENISKDIEVSDATRWVFEKGYEGFSEGVSAFWNDLSPAQKGDFAGDILGRSAVATTAILGTSLGIGFALRGAAAIPQIVGQFFGVGAVSGGIEYSHAIHEYLKAKGMDTNNLDSMAKFVNDPEMMKEANDHALKRGAIIGAVDGLTGGIATRIIAPSVIARSHRSVMPFLKKPVGVPISTPTRYAVNFLAQTPLQVTLPAGAEYFAQLATLEEGEKISYGEVIAEGLGEAFFVPADVLLGGISAYSHHKSASKHVLKDEAYKDGQRTVQNLKERARGEGFETIAGDLFAGDVVQTEASDTTPPGTPLIDTGAIPFFEEAYPLYENNKDINVYANTDVDIKAPNQVFVRPDNQNNFEIVDTYNQIIGKGYNTAEKAGEVAGAFNTILGIRYGNTLSSEASQMQGIDESSDFVNRLSQDMQNPYLGQIEVDEIKENLLNYNFSAYERLINAIGEDATGIDPIAIKNDLSPQDFDTLMNKRAQNINPNAPKSITAKMFENLKKKINVDVDVNSNGFKSLALKLTGEAIFNKMSNPQKRLVYTFLTSLPAHEGATISLPDQSARPYTLKEYNRVVDSLNSGTSPSLSVISSALGLNPQNIDAKRVATRLRQDLVSAGIVNKRGSNYTFNKKGDWSLLRAQQVANATDPQKQEEHKERNKFRNYVVGELNKIGLKEIGVRFDKAMQQRQGQTNVDQTNVDADGYFDPIWKEIFLSLKEAKKGTTSEAEVLTNLFRLIRHEGGIHATRNLDLFSQQEWNNLTNYIMSTPISNKNLNQLIGSEGAKTFIESLGGRNPTYFEAVSLRYDAEEQLNATNNSLNNDAKQEEAVALLAEHWNDKSKKVAGQPRAMLERMKNFFTRINNGLNEFGFQTTDDIFDRLFSGEIGERERIDQTQKPLTINRATRSGKIIGTYEVQPRVIRTPVILQSLIGILQKNTNINIDTGENIPEKAEIEMPVDSRPLQDAPNLKFKLADVMLRPTTIMSEFMRYAREKKYGDDITEIPLAIFDQTIANDARLVRNYGRTLNKQEIQDAQKQIYYYSQKQLETLGYPEFSQDITLYSIGDRKKYNALTPSLREAELIASELKNAPFVIEGNPNIINRHTIKRSQILMTSDMMFATKPPSWLASQDNFFIVGNNSLSFGTEVDYVPITSSRKVIKIKFNPSSPVTVSTPPRKSFSPIKYKLTGLAAKLLQENNIFAHSGSETISKILSVANNNSNWLESLEQIRNTGAYIDREVYGTNFQKIERIDLENVAQEIKIITQESLKDFPNQIRVYRGGRIKSEFDIIPVSLSPEVGKAFSTMGVNKEDFVLESWLIDKNNALANIDAFQPLGYWENELLIDISTLNESVKIAERNNSLDYINYSSPETSERISTIMEELTGKVPDPANLMTIQEFPFMYFPEVSESMNLLNNIGEATQPYPNSLEAKATIPQNTYRFPYGENFADYMAQPEEKRLGTWIRDNLKSYPQPIDQIGQKVKYKLTRDESSGHVADYVPAQYGPPAHQLDIVYSDEVTQDGYYPVSYGFEYPKTSPDYRTREFSIYSTARTPQEIIEEREFVIKLMEIRGDPNATITMYQAAPTKDLQKGDLITPFLSDAKYHVDESKITQEEVRDADRARRRQEQIDKTGAVNLNQERLFNQMEGISDILGRPSEATPSTIHTYELRAGDVRWDGNNGWARWGYFPSNVVDIGTGNIKYKLAYPVTEIEFIESKDNLLELLTAEIPANDLMEHPAIVEGLRRMYSIPETTTIFEQTIGESWEVSTDYMNNREFIINGKKIKGVGKGIVNIIKKAKSYSTNKVGNNKTAYIVLGPPASGKSYFSELIAKKNNLAILDSDDVKKIIPEYKDGLGANATHKESSILTMLVRQYMMSQGTDFLVPNIGGHTKISKISDEIRELKELGYTVNTMVVDVAEPVAQARMYNRYIETGRLVDPQYLAEIFHGNSSPLDTYHRVKYLGDGFAWVDNNGRKNEEIIREDSGIFASAIGEERRTSGRLFTEESETPFQEVISKSPSDLEEVINDAKSINEKMISSGLTPKFNFNASADAIYSAYKNDKIKPESDIIPQSLRIKYSLKNSGKKLDDKTEALIKKLTVRDKMDDRTAGEIILDAAKGVTEDRIRESVIDQYAAIGTLGKLAAKARGRTEEEEAANVGAYQAMHMSERTGEVFKTSFSEGFPIYRDGFVTTENISPKDGKPVIGPVQFLAPGFVNTELLWGFAAVRIAGRETRFNQEGKPVKTTAQDRKDAKDALKKYPEIKEMSDAYDRWDEHVVQFLVDTGVLDTNTAKKWTAHADYFPFFRVMGVDENGKQLVKGPNIFKGMSLSKNIFVKAKGSKDKDIVDPLTGIAENLRAGITLGYKNVASNRVVRDLVDVGFAKQVSLNTKGPDIIKIRVGGKSKAFQVSDPVMFQALQNFDQGGEVFSGFFYSFLRVPKRMLSALITRTPDFWMRQVVRDSVSAWGLLGGKWLPLFSSIKNWGHIWAGMIGKRLPFGLDFDILPKGFDRLRRTGVISGYDNVVQNIDRTDKLIKQAYKQAGITNRGTAKNIAMLPIDTLLGVWNFLGQGTISSDAATRLAVYKDILQKTNNEAEAIWQSMEVLNFTRRGNSKFMQLMAMAVPFQNPRLQGVDVFYRGLTGRYGQKGLTRNQRIRGIMMRFGALMSITPLYWLAVKDSDEYKEATEEKRDNYYIIPGSKNFTGETLGIPTPFEVGLFTKTVPENIIRYFANDITSDDFWDSFTRNVSSTLAISPFQAPILGVATETLTNYNFYTGQPIVPKSMKSLDPAQQYRSSTNNLFIKIGEETNTSPLVLENAWKGFTGTYGAWFATSMDALLREHLDLPVKEALRIDQMPLLGSLILPAEARGYENSFYDLQETTTNLIKTINQMEEKTLEAGDPFAYNLSMEYRREYKNLLQALNKDLNKTGELLTATRKKEEQIRFSTILNAEEKRDQLEVQQAVRNDILKGIDKDRVYWEENIIENIRP